MRPAGVRDLGRGRGVRAGRARERRLGRAPGWVGARLRLMGVLLLVRHGQASLGTADYDRLSDVGRRQAQVTGARLARTDLTVDRVICGGLTRQRDTAEPLLAALGWPASRLRIDDRL